MENKLREVFQKKLNHYEAPVDASSWNAIQSGISGGSTAAGGGGLFASVGAKIIALAMAASILGVSIYFASQKTKTAKQETNIQTENPNQKSVEITAKKIVEKKKNITPKSKSVEVLKKKKIKSPATAKENSVTHANETTKENDGIVSHETTNVLSNSGESSGRVKNESSPTKVLPSDSLQSPTISLQDAINQRTEVDFEVQSLDKEDLSFQLLPIKEIDESVNVLWDFGNGTTSTELSPTIYFDDEGDYNITLSIVHDDKVYQGAQHTARAYYPVKWEIQNIFTPNDDMYNQYFDPAAKAENLTIESVVVYDNTQKMVFSSNEQTKKWDGKLPNGQLAPQGYYFYHVRGIGHDGELNVKKGKVYLITGN